MPLESRSIRISQKHIMLLHGDQYDRKSVVFYFSNKAWYFVSQKNQKIFG